MKPSPRSRPQRINLRPLLEPFIPLLVQQGSEIREEMVANKKWYLGRKEYEYVPTLSGHEPVAV